ncbi:hypothetical protein C0Q70_06949 [Pomacea canaliculata]|uniref:Leucine-rich repeat and WD repeat-containing protein 1 WD domain-containing protein n=1 Tax=Pomacea canaliculata TaxID=400727 RepID=A0A2T7PDN6_POMCA|nr:hypothetical protein C0Q70_06949 [Pomacea canaliculata]
MSRAVRQSQKAAPVCLPDVADYEPRKFLRCHGNSDDDGIKVWSCAFEPSPHKPGETGNILATCGRDTVCLIDVLTGKIMKRFKDPDKEVVMHPVHTFTSVIIESASYALRCLYACAGEGGAVKMIYPDQLVVYDVIRGHRRGINCLCFHSSEPRLLFSGSTDRSIMLWDIGLPVIEMNIYSPLLQINLSDMVGDPLSLMFSASSNTLVSATEKGCFGWALGRVSHLASSKDVIKTPKMSFQHPEDGCSLETIDGLVSLGGGFVATKRVGAGEILVWNLEEHMKSKAKNISITPFVKLQCSKTDVKYISLGYSAGLLCLGDNEGKIYLYNLKDLPKTSMPLLKPSRVLEWPQVDNLKTDKEGEVVINTVAISSDHRFIIGGTDNNLVCVWQQI